MGRWVRPHRLAALLGGIAMLSSGLACGAPPGADVFAAHCAVCHGAKGQGVPGSFPPLAQQIRTFALSPAGRDYLVMAVSTGLIGSVSVAGGVYSGAMPAQGALSEAEVAAVLNYLATAMGRNSTGVQPFDAQEVAAVRARHPGTSGAATLALRPALPDR